MNRRDSHDSRAHDGTGRIVVRDLSKRFGSVEAVRDLSFTVEPGRVTGFLGPNGAGKTTTLRAVLGLVTPTSGEATVNGVRYDQLPRPATVVGAMLDSQGFHRGRTGRAHLRIYAAAIGMPDERVAEVLTLVGLSDAADRKVGGYSLGMRQRLSLATALLGDPRILVLDEPGSGLDPQGVAWLRSFLRAFAAGGRTVLVSSHQLAEVAQTVDHVVIVSQGRQVYAGGLESLHGDGRPRVHVVSSDATRLATALAEQGYSDIQSTPDNGLTVTGATAVTVGDVALAAGVAVHGLTQERTDLERQFLELTTGQYQALPPPGPGEPGPAAVPGNGVTAPGVTAPGVTAPGVTAPGVSAPTPSEPGGAR